MSARSQMIHRMKVERERDNNAVDGHGQPLTDLVTIYDALPCRVWDQEGELIVTEGKVVNIGMHQAIAPYGKDIRENDIISEVADKRGAILFGEARYRVDSLHHFPKQCIVLSMESAQ